MMYFGDHLSGWGWAFMAFGSVLFWAVLIIGIAALVRSLNGDNAFGSGGRSSAEDLLAQRFARGEIDEADYRQRLRILAEPADAPSHWS
jgi:putative membrane protein